MNVFVCVCDRERERELPTVVPKEMMNLRGVPLECLQNFS